MKILWLAPIPYIDIHIDSNIHPAPWILELANSLVESGIELTIINYNRNIKKPVEKKKYKDINLVYVKTPNIKIDIITFYAYRIKIVKNYLKNIENDYDLLHIHGTEHQYEAMANELKIPKLISIQGIMNECIKVLSIKSNFKQYVSWKISCFYEKKFIPKYHYFSCRTNWDKSYIRKHAPNAEIYEIWEMIRENFFHNHYSNNKNTILFVGGKNPIKGLKELLIIYNNSLQKMGLKIIVLGNCQNNDVIKLIKKNNLTNIDVSNIDCRGMQEAKGMIKAYSESFCLVHPTYIDNSPNSICEAQLAGLPVIATDVGGVSTLIENRVTGILIQRGSEHIESSIKTLLNDDIFWKKISKNSRNISRERHNPNKIVNQTIDMYSKIIVKNKKTC